MNRRRLLQCTAALPLVYALGKSDRALSPLSIARASRVRSRLYFCAGGGNFVAPISSCQEGRPRRQSRAQVMGSL
jgi:hypothetical protein